MVAIGAFTRDERLKVIHTKGNQASITTPDGTIDYTYNEATGQLQETKTNSNDEFYYYNSLGQLQDIYTLELNGTSYGAFGGFNSTTDLPTFSGSPLITAYTYDNDGTLYMPTNSSGTGQINLAVDAGSTSNDPLTWNISGDVATPTGGTFPLQGSTSVTNLQVITVTPTSGGFYVITVGDAQGHSLSVDVRVLTQEIDADMLHSYQFSLVSKLEIRRIGPILHRLQFITTKVFARELLPKNMEGLLLWFGKSWHVAIIELGHSHQRVFSLVSIAHLTRSAISIDQKTRPSGRQFDLDP